MKKLGSSSNHNALWYCLWGVMAVIAFAGAVSSYHLLSGKPLFFLDIILAAVAAIQLSQGVSFLRRREAVLAAVALVLFGAAQPVQWLLRLPVSAPSPDFGAYYVAGKLVAEKKSADLYQLPLNADGRLGMFDVRRSDSIWQQAAHRYGVALSTPYVYPPIFAVLMRPLVSLSFGRARVLWSALTVLSIFFACAICLDLGGVGLSLGLVLMLVVGTLSFYPVFDELLFGQVGGFILLLWALCAWFLQRNRVWPSAFCFALASVMKLTPLIAVPLFVFRRKWKWLAAYVGWMLCLLAFSIWQAGWAAHVEFFNKVMPSISCGLPALQNASLVGYIQELFVGRVFSVSSAPLTIPAVACRVSKAAALIAYLAMMVRFYLYREGNLVRHLVLATLLSLAISPISWWHHYTLALLPLIYLWCTMREQDRDMLLLLTALVVGTNIAGFALMVLTNHAAQLIVAAVVPCLTLALVYFRTPSNVRHGTIAPKVCQ